MQFSEKLKKLRADKGVSQSELADKIYVSRSAVAKWENGLGLPSDESLTLLSEYFGVNKSDLLSDPETATVIVNKNHALSKQKLWIYVLIALSCALIVVAAVLFPLVLKNPSSDTNTPAEPTIIQELIFETEKDVDDLDAKNYSDAEISTDKYFAPTRIFTYTSRNTTIILPKVLFKTTMGSEVSYHGIHDLSCTVSENCTVSYDVHTNLFYIVATDSPYSAKSEYCVNLAFGDMRLSFKIRQEPIEVEEIYIDMQNIDGTVLGGLGSRVGITTFVSPMDATYQAMRYTVEKIVKADGSLYDDKLSQYAYFGGIEDDIYLYITPTIEIGAKIYVYAEAEKDQVRSNMLEVEVKRIPIKDISIETNKSDSLMLGTSCWFRLLAEEENASFNVKDEKFEVTLLTPELAEIEYSSGINMYFLTITDDYTKIGEVVKIRITTPEGFSKLFYWTIEAPPAEKVIIVNADTGEELDEEFTMIKGETMRFEIKVLPEYAAYEQKEFKYNLNNPNCFTFIQEDDILTVTVSQNATRDIYETFYAQVINSSPYNSVDSKVATIKVAPTPIDNIILKTNRDTLIKGGGVAYYAVLTIEIFPADGEITTISLGHNSVTGVELKYWTTDNRFYIGADYTAIGGSEARYTVYYNGRRQSNTVTLTVQEVPVEQVTLDIESLNVKKGKAYTLNLQYNLGADPHSIEFKLLDEVEGVDLNSDNLLCIHKTAIVGAKFRVQAIVDGVESNILNLEVVDTPPPDEIFELPKGMFYKLNELYYIDAELFYLPELTDQSQLKIINSNVLIIFTSAPTGMTFQVNAIIDGVVDRVFTLKVVDCEEPDTIKKVPHFAQYIWSYYPDVDKNLVEFIFLDEVDESDVYLINSNILIIQDDAPSGMIFRLLAIIDGVPDKVYTFMVA